MSHYSINLHKGGAGKASNTSVLLNESWTCFQLTLVRILKCAWAGAMVLCFSWSDLDISASYFQQTLWLVSFTGISTKPGDLQLQMSMVWYLTPQVEVRWLVCLVFPPDGCIWTTWKHHGAAFFFFQEAKSALKGAKSRGISFCKHVLGLQED